MDKLDTFIEKNYKKIKKHLFQEGKELGYKRKELEDYFFDTKCFIFCGTIDELKKEVKTKDSYYPIAQEDNLIIAEMFNGLTYEFI